MDVVLKSVRMVEELDDCPDLSWLETELDARGNIVSSCRYTQDDLQRYGREKVLSWIEEDRHRLSSYGDEWWMIGIYAEAKLLVKGVIQTIRSGGLWGIESDCGYKQEIAREELSSLREILVAMGVDVRDFDSQVAGAVVQE